MFYAVILPHNKKVDFPKLKGFEDDNLNLAHVTEFVFDFLLSL